MWSLLQQLRSQGCCTRNKSCSGCCPCKWPDCSRGCCGCGWRRLAATVPNIVPTIPDVNEKSVAAFTTEQPATATDILKENPTNNAKYVEGALTEWSPSYIAHDGGVNFSASSILDSGIEVGASLSLKIKAKDSVDADGTSAYISGSFGKIIFGNTDPASKQLAITAPSGGYGVNGEDYFLVSRSADPTYINVVGGAAGSKDLAAKVYGIKDDDQGPTTAFDGTAGDATYTFKSSKGDNGTKVGFGGDGNKIVYLSPALMGFQGALSYTPNVDKKSSTSGTIKDTANSAYAFSAKYTHDLAASGTSLAGYFGFTKETLSEANKLAVKDWNPGKITKGDQTAWAAGLSVGWQGLSVGGSYYTNDNGYSADNESTGFDLGVGYAMGPWSVGATYLMSTRKNSFSQVVAKVTAATGATVAADGSLELRNISFENKYSAWGIGGSYALAPGVAAKASFVNWEEDNAEAARVDAKGSSFVVGLSVDF